YIQLSPASGKNVYKQRSRRWTGLSGNNYFNAMVFQCLDGAWWCSGICYHILYLLQFAYLSNTTFTKFGTVGQHRYDLRRADHFLIDAGFSEIADRKTKIKINSVHTYK